jgi:RNA polymerase-interacting CarD/CdnL/TRCF family regulator
MPGNEYNVGDWIIHIEHGVGQITDKEGDAFRVEAFTSVYRFSPGQINVDQIRPIASTEQMNQALELMQEPPQNLSDTSKEREKEISHARQDISLETKVRIIRDLHGKNVVDSIDLAEELFLIKFKKEFTNELSVIMQEDVERAEERMIQALSESISKSSPL